MLMPRERRPFHSRDMLNISFHGLPADAPAAMFASVATVTRRAARRR